LIFKKIIIISFNICGFNLRLALPFSDGDGSTSCGFPEVVKSTVLLLAAVFSTSEQPWDRCYDFLDIFAEKFSEKIGIFDAKQS
jgi:hypothetical protein